MNPKLFLRGKCKTTIKKENLGKTAKEEKKENQENFVSYSRVGLQINAVKKACCQQLALTFSLRAVLFAEKADLVTNGWGSCTPCNLHNLTFFSHSSFTHSTKKAMHIYF